MKSRTLIDKTNITHVIIKDDTVQI
jgi:hypothetical protein